MMGRTALLIIDMQCDFAKPGGKLYVKDGESTIPIIKELLEMARRNDLPVVYSVDAHFNPDPEFETWPLHCVAGTPGAEIVEELLPDFDRGEILIRKGSFEYSAFAPEFREESHLTRLLQDRKVERLVVTGLAYDFCAGSTACDGTKAGFEVYLVSEATKAVDIVSEGVSTRKAMDERLQSVGVKIVSLEEARELLKAI
ncbi:MAG: isochorismatase family cysteine hydrolase [Actinomycetota bacterium]